VLATLLVRRDLEGLRSPLVVRLFAARIPSGSGDRRSWPHRRPWSRREAVAVMKTTEERGGDDLGAFGWPDRAEMSGGFGGLHVEATMGPAYVVGQVVRENMLCMAPIANNNMVRLLRWDVEIDLAAGVVTRAGEEPAKLTPEAVAMLQKRRDGMRGFAGVGDLVFPSDVGGFVSPSCLDKPFEKIAETAKIKKLVTPRAMRRTAQDLSRLAGVNDLVTRAVSGHSDVAMQELYSTVRGRRDAEVTRRRGSARGALGSTGGDESAATLDE